MQLPVTLTPAKKISMAIIACIAWFALVLQLYIMLVKAPSIGITAINTIINFFSFFTILSNLLIAVTLSFSLLSPASRVGLFFSRPSVQSAIALYIFIVGLVYNLVLRNLWTPTGTQLIVDNLLHVAVPLLYVLFWFIFIPKGILHWKNGIPWLLFPFVYLFYSMIRGAFTNWYPYPFLNATELGYSKVLLNITVMIAAFLVVGLLLIAINRSMKR